MTDKCPYCAGVARPGVCPMVKAIEYCPDGTVKRVEFKCAADWVMPVNIPSVWRAWGESLPPQTQWEAPLSGFDYPTR